MLDDENACQSFVDRSQKSSVVQRAPISSQHRHEGLQLPAGIVTVDVDDADVAFDTNDDHDGGLLGPEIRAGPSERRGQ